MIVLESLGRIWLFTSHQADKLITFIAGNYKQGFALYILKIDYSLVTTVRTTLESRIRSSDERYKVENDGVNQSSKLQARLPKNGRPGQQERWPDRNLKLMQLETGNHHARTNHDHDKLKVVKKSDGVINNDTFYVSLL